MSKDWYKSKVETRVFDDGTYTVVAYHGTPVVRFNDDVIILNTGGWDTKTTKERMNQASREYGLGYQIVQEDFTWYIIWKGQKMEFISQEVTLHRR